MPPRPTTTPQGVEYDIEGNEIQKPEIEASGSEETTEQLKARIARLEAALAHSDISRQSAEEESARLSAQAQSSLFTTNVTERYSRKSADGKTDIWWYRVDLSPCGGTDIRLNGIQYVHGETYEFPTDVLRSVKEIVSRTWLHEASVHGENENVYKRAQDRVLRGAGRR